MPKYDINFSDTAYDALIELARELGQTTTDVIRDALTTYWWLAQEQRKGKMFLLQFEGKQSGIVFPNLARSAMQSITTDSTPIAVADKQTDAIESSMGRTPSDQLTPPIGELRRGGCR